MSLLHYAIRVTTDEALYDETYGMSSTGVFTWISGNPGYTGAAASGATGEAGLTGVNIRWNEGWLPEGGIGTPSREIDIQVAGNYGTQSGFSFRLADAKAGASSQFRKFVSDNDIKFTGRKVELFTVIDDVFYTTWTGKVSNNPVDEATFQFSCDDTYKQLHKIMPPTAISESNYPNAVGDAKCIPICFGDVPYAEAMQIEGNAKRIPLAQSAQGQEFDVVPMYKADRIYYGDADYPWDLGVTGTTVYTYDLWTYGKSFETGALQDGTYYLNVTHGTDPVSTILSSASWIGDFPDTSQLAPVIGSSTTTGPAALPTRTSEMTKFCTSVPIFGHNITGFGGAYGQDWEFKIMVPQQVLENQEIYVVNDERYWFSLVRLPTEWIVSNGAISSFLENKSSHIQLYYFDSGTRAWNDISHQVLNTGTVTAEGHQAFRAPRGLVGESLIPAGVDNYAAMILFDIPKVSLVKTAGFNYPASSGQLLINGSRDRSVTCNVATGTGTDASGHTSIQGTGVDCLTFDIFITDELRKSLDDAGCQDLYLVPDFTLWTGDAATKANPGLLFQVSVDPLTVQGLRLDVDNTSYQSKVAFPTSSYFPVERFWWTVGGTSNFINGPMIPSKYWRSRGWDCEDASDAFGSWDNNFDEHYSGQHIIDIWGAFSFLYKDAWKLKCQNDLIEDTRIQRLRVTIRACRYGNAQPSQVWTVKWHQFALIGMKSVDLAQKGLYTRVKGETHLGRQTNSVFQAFRKMLEGYDGIPLADIDYGNLPWTRDSWHVGRQITEQKSSFEYIQELAQQSFVGVVPKRDGKRKLSAWREDIYTTALVHSNLTILRDGMVSMEQTPLNQVYNEFSMRFSWDPGAKDYVRTLFVTKADQTTFPTLDGQWGEYVGSNIVNEDSTSPSGDFSSDTAYPDCKDVWTICHNSYLRTKVISRDVGAEYTDLPWYIDYSEFEPESDEYQGVDSAAWKYFRNFAQWTSRQKDTVQYRLPLTATNIQQVELLAPVDFSDAIWTSGSNRNGWVVGVQIDPATDSMVVTTILEPSTIAVDSDEFIQEIGSVYGAYISDPTITENGTADTVTETGVTL